MGTKRGPGYLVYQGDRSFILEREEDGNHKRIRVQTKELAEATGGKGDWISNYSDFLVIV